MRLGSLSAIEDKMIREKVNGCSHHTPEAGRPMSGAAENMRSVVSRCHAVPNDLRQILDSRREEDRARRCDARESSKLKSRGSRPVRFLQSMLMPVQIATRAIAPTPSPNLAQLANGSNRGLSVTSTTCARPIRCCGARLLCARREPKAYRWPRPRRLHLALA
jgi:hypothetical protein